MSEILTMDFWAGIFIGCLICILCILVNGRKEIEELIEKLGRGGSL